MPQSVSRYFHEYLPNRKGKCTQWVDMGRKRPPALCSLLADAEVHTSWEPSCYDDVHNNLTLTSATECSPGEVGTLTLTCGDCGRSLYLQA